MKAKYCALFFAFALTRLFSQDFGLIVTEEAVETGESSAALFSTRTLVAPWVSVPLWNQANLHVSAGVSFIWQQDIDPLFIPEILRMEFAWQPGSFSLRAGRISYSDPAGGFTVKGLFDGVEANFSLGAVDLGLAVFYTGFLCRQTANVNYVSSPGDPVPYGAPLSQDDFMHFPFAVPRLFGGIQAQIAGLPEGRGSLKTALLWQQDFSESFRKISSGYVLLGYAVALPWNLDLEVDGAAELELSDGDLIFGMAASVEAAWSFFAPLAGRVWLGGRWASDRDGDMTAFFPLTREAQGVIFRPVLSGLMALKTGGVFRLHRSFSAEINLRYFMRTGSTAIEDPDFGPDGYFLGGEAAAALLWVPFSDLLINLEGGVFFPQAGDAANPDAPLRWRVALTLVFSL